MVTEVKRAGVCTTVVGFGLVCFLTKQNENRSDEGCVQLET